MRDTRDLRARQIIAGTLQENLLREISEKHKKFLEDVPNEQGPIMIPVAIKTGYKTKPWKTKTIMKDGKYE